MGIHETEEPLLAADIESQGVVGRISRVNEDFVSLPESQSEAGAHVSNGEGLAVNRTRNNGSVVLAISICCIAAILFVSAGVVSYNTTIQLQKIQMLAGGNKVGHLQLGSRTTYHFQPESSWMNDPNAPMYYGGFYHFFYQYDPNSVQGGNISWGHAVSTDLIHWMYLDVALYPDQWYDIKGVWSGSATILENGTPAMLYTGGSIDENGDSVQSQAMALPVDPTDPLLRKWYKPETNPIVMPPPGIKTDDFRDPSTAWLEGDGMWRLVIGSKLDNDDGTMDGMSLIYQSRDFFNWDLQVGFLHQVPGTGMWECVDFYPVTTKPKSQVETADSLKAQNAFGLQHHAAKTGENYVETFKYVLKASLDTWTEDHYTIGTYSTATHRFTVDDPTLDIGKGYLYDYGKFYASKTFYDSSTGRRIVWSWVNESDSQEDDIIKGWASLQAIPRTIWLDEMTMKNLLTWPVEEVESLRGAKASYQDIVLQEGDVINVDGGEGSQLDIVISFEKPDVYAVGNVDPERFECPQGGSARKGVFGPFGVLVHADAALTEQTAVYVYIAPSAGGQWSTRVCSDQSRSSLEKGIDKTVYGSSVTVLDEESEISLRILLDHSIVETFAMGGRMAITSRVYPTRAVKQDSRLFLFNNGTTPVKVTNFDVYKMVDVHMIPI